MYQRLCLSSRHLRCQVTALRLLPAAAATPEGRGIRSAPLNLRSAERLNRGEGGTSTTACAAHAGERATNLLLLLPPIHPKQALRKKHAWRWIRRAQEPTFPVMGRVVPSSHNPMSSWLGDCTERCYLNRSHADQLPCARSRRCRIWHAQSQEAKTSASQNLTPRATWKRK